MVRILNDRKNSCTNQEHTSEVWKNQKVLKKVYQTFQLVAKLEDIDEYRLELR